jgi:hypothetical protein
MKKRSIFTGLGIVALIMAMGLVLGGCDSPAGDNSGANSSAAPGKVTGVTVTPSTTSIKVSWDAVDGATGYTVYYESDDDEEEANVAKTSVTINALKAGTEYTVYVAAYNSKGEGTASSKQKATTKTAASGDNTNTNDTTNNNNTNNTNTEPSVQSGSVKFSSSTLSMSAKTLGFKGDDTIDGVTMSHVGDWELDSDDFTNVTLKAEISYSGSQIKLKISMVAEELEKNKDFKSGNTGIYTTKTYTANADGAVSKITTSPLTQTVGGIKEGKYGDKEIDLGSSGWLKNVRVHVDGSGSSKTDYDDQAWEMDTITVEYEYNE